MYIRHIYCIFNILCLYFYYNLYVSSLHIYHHINTFFTAAIKLILNLIFACFLLNFTITYSFYLFFNLKNNLKYVNFYLKICWKLLSYYMINCINISGFIFLFLPFSYFMWCFLCFLFACILKLHLFERIYILFLFYVYSFISFLTICCGILLYIFLFGLPYPLKSFLNQKKQSAKKLFHNSDFFVNFSLVAL